MMIRVVSVSTNLGANISHVAFKVIDDSTALHRVIDEFETQLEGRFDNPEDPDLIALLVARVEEARNA